MSVNKFIGIGNLGKDPETRVMPDGKAVTNISIAITERYKDKQGNKQEVTEWVNVAFFGKLAEIVAQYLTKGSQVYVEGKLRTDKYEKNGQTHYSTKVIGESMQMLGGKVQESKPKEEAPSKAPKSPPDFSELDDDMPF